MVVLSKKMNQNTLKLSIALSENERTKPILNGEVKAKGIDFFTTGVHPSEMFWRQLKFKDFDVSEMSLSSLIIATSKGNREWVALPIFTSRKFFHTNILIRSDKGIHSPGDLKGKKIGVPEYQQTAAIWARAALEHEFGVSPTDIEWFMERNSGKSHGGATGFNPPARVRINTIPTTTNIGEMLSSGEIDGTLLYLNNANLVDRSQLQLNENNKVISLFRNKQKESQRYFQKTGIYPINHTVVIKRELYEAHPWLAINIYHAFMEAKNMMHDLTKENLKAYFETGLSGLFNESALVTNDPKSYGILANRHIIELLIKYIHEQGLISQPLALVDLFAQQTLEL